MGVWAQRWDEELAIWDSEKSKYSCTSKGVKVLKHLSRMLPGHLLVCEMFQSCPFQEEDLRHPQDMLSAGSEVPLCPPKWAGGGGRKAEGLDVSA